MFERRKKILNLETGRDVDSKGTGRIPLDIFSRSHAGSAYDFTEGIFDESVILLEFAYDCIISSLTNQLGIVCRLASFAILS